MSTAPAAPPHLQVRLDATVPVLVIPAGLPFEELRAWLRERLPEQAEVIGGRASRLDLGEREIQLFDLRRLIHFLREEHGLDILGLYVRESAVHRFAERELKLKLFIQEAPQPQPPVSQPGLEVADDAETEELSGVADDEDAGDDEIVEPEVARVDAVSLPHDLEPGDLEPEGRVERRDDGQRTLTLRRTLRSGAVVRFDGDLIVFGDVNPGAHVVATGNIVVLGALKGMAHAGAAGAEDSFILALHLRPTQLRIARRIAIAPERPDTGAVALPEMASVIDGQIVIEAYKGRLR